MSKKPFTHSKSGIRHRDVKRWAVYSRTMDACGWPRCVYCGAGGQGVPMSVDHAIPGEGDGGPGLTNLVCACLSCNTRKGACRADDEAVRWLAEHPVTMADGLEYIAEHPHIFEAVKAASDFRNNGVLWGFDPRTLAEGK